MEFALLVELTIIRQLKLKWVCVSVWPVSVLKPRCKYWYHLHEGLIPSLPHTQGFNSLLSSQQNRKRSTASRGREGWKNGKEETDAAER